MSEQSGTLVLNSEALVSRHDPDGRLASYLVFLGSENRRVNLVSRETGRGGMLRLIAESLPDANIADILAAVGSDRRIGKAYLQPGLSYGGPCFPRDNRLVAYTARQIQGTAPLAEASDQVNETTKDRLAEQVLHHNY